MSENKKIECVGDPLHPGQYRIQQNIVNQDDIMFHCINASRQSGKSFLLKQLLLYYALNNNNESLLVVSPFYIQNMKIYDEVLDAVVDTGIVKKHNRTDKFIQFINGSQINFRSAENDKAIRGGTYTYLFLDEFAYYKPDVYKLAILPTISTRKNAKVFIFSTPRGKNEFYELAMRGQSNHPNDKQYAYYFMSYKDNPLYNIQFVEDCRRYYPNKKFQQEFEGMFVDNASVFEGYSNCAVVSAYSYPVANMSYFAGLDLARKKDFTWLVIMDSNGRVVNQLKINMSTWEKIVDDVVAMLVRYNAHCIIEVNSIGDVVFELIQKKYYNITPIFTSNSTKREYIEQLIYAFNTMDIEIPTAELDPELHLQLDVFEMSFSPKNRSVVYSARQGFHDDAVISLALANKCKKDYISLQGPTRYRMRTINMQKTK